MDRRCHKCHRHPRRPRSLAADAEGVKLVAFAVAIAFGDVRTSALVDGARAVADAALVEFSNTWIDVVTNAIGIFVGRAVTAADTEGVKLVAVAVAIAFGDVRTSTLVDLSRAVAHAALVECANTWIDVVTNAIGIFVGRAVTAADAEGVKLVAVTVAIAFWDVSTSALVDGARAVADAALVVGTHTVVYVVTDAIGILVGRAVLAADAEGVKLVAFAVAIAFGDVRTSALVDLSRPLHTPHSSSAPTHGSMLSRAPSASSSAAQSCRRHRGRQAGCRRSRCSGCEHPHS